MDGEGQQADDNAWGDDIPPERQAELEALVQSQAEWAAKPEVERGESAFKNVRLTGAEVFWLAARTLAGVADKQAIVEQMARLRARRDYVSLDGLRLEGAGLRAARLEGAILSAAHLEGALLSEAHLEAAILIATHLEAAGLRAARLEGADLRGARLEGAFLIETHLEAAGLRAAHLEGAILSEAHLEGADLSEAHLEGADLSGAHLEGANLSEAHLEGRHFDHSDPDLQHIQQWANDFPAVLPPADLRLAYFDRVTQLTDATLGTTELGYVRVADTRWGEVNLAVVDWGDAPILYDERAAREGKSDKHHADAKRPMRHERRQGRHKQRAERLSRFREAARANRQLAAVLRDQGLSDAADLFAYRAQVLQRTVLRLQGRRLAATGSWLLDFISGYGYEPLRSLATYVMVILGFAVAYRLLGNQVTPPLGPLDAVVFSVTSFHGRGFSPGEVVTLHNPLTVLAAIEAIIGLLIEITFIATFTQRFFAR